MLKFLFVLPTLLFLALIPQQSASPSADASTLTNPITPTPESQARARSLYKMDCAMCHGENGNGKGDLVGDMGLTLKNLHDPATLKDRSDGELFTLIKDGKGKMPSEGDRAKPDEIWNLVVLVRSFAK